MKDIINDSKTWLVDVRNPDEVALAGVEGAENIPMHTVMDHIDRFKSHDGEIVVFCASGNRSGQVTQYLTQSGCSNVHNGGGFRDVEALKD